MKNTLFVILQFLLIPGYAFCQAPIETKMDYALFSSGKTKVEIRNNNQLDEVRYIDSARKVIRNLILVPLDTNPLAPRFDNTYRIYYLSTEYFSAPGRYDSSFSIHYSQHPSATGNPVYYVDSNLSIINYTLSREEYYVIKGRRAKLQSISPFKFNTKNQLISLTQTEGMVVHTYTYNEKGQLEKEVIANRITYFYTYDAAGRLIDKKGPSVRFTYEYDEHSLLKKKTQKTATDTQVWLYTYE